jgi:MYXO-CTERM domain-containing protein
LAALNAVTGSQAMSITYWEFLDSTPSSTAFWGTSPSAVGVGGQRGLNAHSPWSDGNVYFDTAGCCDGTNRIAGPLGATLGDWQLITLVYNAGTRIAYRNTTQVATGSGGIPLASDINAFIVGNDNLMATLGMDAKLDNFTIWSGALTTQEIAALAVRPVPEPSAWMLGLLGALAAGFRRSRR